jgi:hypothetical protein
VIAGLAAWTITLLAGQASGPVTAAVTSPALIGPYLAVTAACVAVVLYTTRIPGETS